MALTNKSRDTAVLRSLVFGDEWLPAALPAATDLILHARIGDVLETSPGTVDFLLNHPFTSCGQCKRMQNYSAEACEKMLRIKKMEYYRGIHGTVVSKGLNVARVVIVAGAHNSTGNLRKSRAYIQRIASFWRNRGFAVVEKVAELPSEARPMDQQKAADEDFVFMSHSRHFVVGGGGFSMVIGEVVKMNGGTVLGLPKGRPVFGCIEKDNF